METKHEDLEKKAINYGMQHTKIQEDIKLLKKSLHSIKNTVVKFDLSEIEHSTDSIIIIDVIISKINMSGFTAAVILYKLDELGYLINSRINNKGEIEVSFFL